MLSLSEKQKILSYSAQFKEKNIPQYWEWATAQYELSQLKNPYRIDEYISSPTKLLFAYNKIEGLAVKRLLIERKISLKDVRFEIDRYPNDSVHMIQMVKYNYVLNPKWPAYLESLRKIEQKRSEIETMLVPLERELLQIISYWEGDGEFHS